MRFIFLWYFIFSWYNSVLGSKLLLAVGKASTTPLY